MQYRDLPLARAEFKFMDAGGAGTALRFSGMASTYGDKDLNGDIVVPGAFAASLLPANRAHPIYMLKQHDRENVIGKWLTIEDRPDGLYVEGELTPGHSVANDVAASMRHDAMDGLSVGYLVNAGGEKKSAGGRLLTDLYLAEISVVSFNANMGAKVLDIKAIEDMNSLSCVEERLREAAGLTRMEAKAFVAQVRRLQSATGADDADDDDLLREAASDSLSGAVVLERIAQLKFSLSR